jgi:hypothetical protein
VNPLDIAIGAVVFAVLVGALLVAWAVVSHERRRGGAEAVVRVHASEAVALLRELVTLSRHAAEPLPPARTLIACTYATEHESAWRASVEVLLVCDEGGAARLVPQVPITLLRVRVLEPYDAVIITVQVGRDIVSEYLADLRDLNKTVPVPVGCHVQIQTARAEARRRA